MSRDGSGVYHRPVGTDAVTDTTIESTKYNVNVADVETDLNLPRPIVAGGTGASSAAQALVNLSAEAAGQIVTNYDSQLWQAGSFYSAVGATAAPVTGHSFSGICYVSDPPAYPPTNLNVTLEARDRDDTMVPGALWIRVKKAGVWSAWFNTNPVVTSPPGSPGVPPSNAPDNSFWWDATRGKLFVRYNDGDSTQWVEAVAVPDLDPNMFVKIAGSTMTGPLKLVTPPVASNDAASKTYVDSSAISNSGYFTWSSATLVQLQPYNGDAVRVNGAMLKIPGGNIGAANTSIFLNGTGGLNLAANTLYYVYLFSNAGTPTIDFSTTAYASSVTAGNVGTMIKSGDDTRTLIGMVYTNASSQFATNNVISWFNKKRRHGTLQSTSFSTNVAGQFPIDFCTWADEAISYHMTAQMANSVLGGAINCIPAIDGVNQPQIANGQAFAAGAQVTVSQNAARLLSAGRHVVSMTVSTSGTVTSGAGENSVLFRG